MNKKQRKKIKEIVKNLQNNNGCINVAAAADDDDDDDNDDYDDDDDDVKQLRTNTIPLHVVLIRRKRKKREGTKWKSCKAWSRK